MTLDEARAARRENRRKMKSASPAVREICQKLDALYGQYIAALSAA